MHTPLTHKNELIMENTKRFKYRERFARLLKQAEKPLPLPGISSERKYPKPLKAWKGFERISITENCMWTAAWRVLTQHLRQHIERREYGCENFVSYCSQTLNRWFQFIDYFCMCQCLFCGDVVWQFAAKQKNKYETRLKKYFILIRAISQQKSDKRNWSWILLLKVLDALASFFQITGK